MAVLFKQPRNTKAALDAKAGAGTLVPYATYWLTDTSRLAIATSTTNYVEINAGGGGATTYSLTLTSVGGGAPSGSIFNGSAPVSISYDSIGAIGLGSEITNLGSTLSGVLFGRASAVNLLSPAEYITLGQGFLFSGTVLNQSLISYASAVATANFAATATATTLTATANGVTTFDGVALTANMVVVLPNQTTAAQNGVYTVTTAGTASAATVLTRLAPFNTASGLNRAPDVVVQNGTVWSGTTWQVFMAPGGTLGTAAVVANPIAGLGTTVSQSGVGYSAGSGGSVTQATSRTTGVTLNKASGSITLFSTTTAANTPVSFTLTNSLVTANDVLMISLRTSTSNNYFFSTKCAAGSAIITINTPVAITTAEAPVINFVLLKGSSS